MNLTKPIYYWIFINAIIGFSLFTSCSDDDEMNFSNINSSLRLLPSKMSIEYKDGQKHIFDYTYNNDNQLISYTETSLFGSNISFEDMETTCTVTYNTEGEIDSLIIVPRFLDVEKSKTVGNQIYPLVNDTILFNRQGDIITITYKRKSSEHIYLDSMNRVIAYKYISTDDNQIPIINTFQYDNDGNIITSTIDHKYADETRNNPSPYSYIYDNKNGVFANINSPQWFLVIMLNFDFNLVNNNLAYMDSENEKWEITYNYNEDDYPMYWTSHSSSTTTSLSTSDILSTSVDYIKAR